MSAQKNKPCHLTVIGCEAAEEIYRRSHRPSLLQSPLYAAAYGAFAGWSPRALKVDIDGREAGMVQLLVRRRGFWEQVTLDQGPVWLPGFDTPAHNAAFFEEWVACYGAGLFRKRRVIPAMDAAMGVDLTAIGLRPVPGSAYVTSWCDLENGARLRKNWRGMVARAQREGVVIEWDTRGRTLDWLLRHEAVVRAEKQYPGPAPALIRALAPAFIEQEQLIVGRALWGGRPVAGALFMLHPPAATYQLAWTGAEGRACGAQNLLLWEGLRILKQRAIRYLDLGGINDVSARSVSYFKRGLGGEIIHQSGIYH